jgi:hypothetical protein
MKKFATIVLALLVLAGAALAQAGAQEGQSQTM